MPENDIQTKLLEEVGKFKVDLSKEFDAKIEEVKKENTELKTELGVQKNLTSELNVLIVKQNSRKKELESKYDDDSIKFLETVSQSSFEAYTAKGKEFGLFTNSNPEGGILVPKQMLNELLKFIFSEGSTEIAALPRTIRRMAKAIEVPIQSGIPVFTASEECKSARCSTPKFHSSTLVGKKASACIESSWEALNYQSVYLENEIITDLRNALSDYLSFQILNGLGTNGANNAYLGVLNDERVENIDAAAAALSFDLLFNLETELLRGNNPVLIMSKQNRNKLRQLKGTDGQYLDPRFGELPRIIDTGKVTIGEPDPTNPTELAIEKVVNLMPQDKVIIGDFKRGYMQLLIEDLIVIRDPFTSARKNCVNWNFHHYSDGMPVLPDAFKILSNFI